MTSKIRKVTKRTLKNQEVLDLYVTNYGGGSKMFRVKVRVKRIILENHQSLKMLKLGESIRKLRTRSRRR